MTADERPPFGAADVIEISSKFEADDDAFIIGGQATNFWAWFYQDKEPDLKLKGPFTSEDIDYFGSREVAYAVAAALNGQLLLPVEGDHTPSTAQIVTQLHGKPLVIDFLGTVLGIYDRELRNGVSILEVAGDIEGRSVKVLIKVLHPLLCLKSRIVNMLHPATRRTDRIARTQAEASIVIVRRYIHDALDEQNGWKEARDCLATLYWYIRRDQYVKEADLKLGIDPVTIIRAFVDDARVDKRYRELQLKKMVANIQKRRASRR
jgi:hypothetical protein